MHETQTVAIDNDFLNHLLGIRKHPDLISLIKSFFNALCVVPVMHPLVYDREAIIRPDKTRDVLFRDGTISKVELVDILSSQDGGVQYYSLLIKDIYRQFMGKEYPCSDIINDWLAGQSLGEVHTVVMCAFLLYDCFLSDDGDAALKLQGIVNRRLNWSIAIYSRKNRCDYLRSLDISQRAGLTLNDLNKLSHSRE